MNKKIILISAAFPYEPSEQFLETEIPYWNNYKDIELVIMPYSKNNKIRKIPKNIEINNTLFNNKMNFLNILKYSIKIFNSKIFYNELKNIFNKPYVISITIKKLIKLLYYKDLLEKYIKNENKELIFYTYWYDELTYALQLLKKDYNIKVITRIHGYDLYEEREMFNYFPFRKQFLKNIDKIFTITDSAKNYLLNKYNYDPSIIETSKLGVNDYNIITKPNISKKLVIVSCSSLIRLKRVDKIMIVLYKLAKNNKKLMIEWTHIGDGPLKKILLKYIEIFPNLKINFIGNIENDKIYKYYKNHKIDVFINVSETEGVPVSIMEAMSCHIPIIAPDIGGIRDMVINDYNGILLSKKATIREIEKALLKITFFKNHKIRENSYKVYKKNYDASINYNSFIKKLKNI